MKTVKSKKDLNKFALDEGAEITNQHGKKFNAGGEKNDSPVLFRKKKPKLPEPEPEKPSLDTERMVIALEDISKDNRKIMADITKQLAGIQFEAVAMPDRWEFDVIRGKDKLIQKVIAKAVYHSGTKH